MSHIFAFFIKERFSVTQSQMLVASGDQAQLTHSLQFLC